MILGKLEARKLGSLSPDPRAWATMGAVDEVDHPLGVAPESEPPRRQPLTLGIVAVVALLLIAWAAGWSRQTPEVLAGETSSAPDPGPDRGPLLVGVTQPATKPGQPNLSLVEVSPVISRNDAEAEVSFMICAPRRARQPLGSVRDPIEDHCTSTRPAEDTTLRVAGEQIVMVVAPTRQGVVRIDEVEVTYRQGWQLLWLPRTVTMAVSAKMKVTSS